MMVRLLDMAEIELDEAVAWYEAQVPGLGLKLVAEIRHAREMIAAFPGAWHLLDTGVRRYRLNRFPFGLIYTIENGEIIILAIAHHHREPGYWRERLRSKS